MLFKFPRQPGCDPLARLVTGTFTIVCNVRSIYTQLCTYALLALLDRRDQSGHVRTCPNLVLCIMTTVGMNTSEWRAEDLQSVSVTQSQMWSHVSINSTYRNCFQLCVLKVLFLKTTESWGVLHRTVERIINLLHLTQSLSAKTEWSTDRRQGYHDECAVCWWINTTYPLWPPDDGPSCVWHAGIVISVLLQ